MNRRVPPTLPHIAGTPGEGARRAGLLRMAAPLALALFLAGFLAGVAVPEALRPDTATAGWALVALGAALLLLTTRIRGRWQAFFRGAQGEQEVANRLARLPATFSVYHGVRLPGAAAGPGGDLDHVVVGPDTLWVIETKNWRGQVSMADGRLWLDGKAPDRDPLQQARDAATALTAALSDGGNAGFPVQSVVCFATNRLRGGLCPAEDVIVCNADELIDVVSSSQGLPVSSPIRHHAEKRLHAWKTADERT